MTYPVSEIFVSPQGEGVYTGTLMCFIRLAGCTVGRKYPKAMYELREVVTPQVVNVGESIRTKEVLPIYTEMCTLYDGRTFACDTDYRMKEKLDAADILARIPGDVRHVCITGGEPFMHDLEALVVGLRRCSKFVHIETSGTLLLEKAFPLLIRSSCTSDLWITVSPKYGVLDEMIVRADEIKLLVDEDFDWTKVPVQIRNHHRVYIQPVNHEHDIRQWNLRRCMELQRDHPHLRLSLQLHKVLRHYLEEIVR